MRSVGQRPKDGTSSVNTLEGESVTGPVELDILLLQSKEGNQGTNSDGAGEGS